MKDPYWMRLTNATQDVSKCMNRLGSISCSARTKFNGDGAIRLRKLARGPHRWSCSRLRADESTERSKPCVQAHHQPFFPNRTTKRSGRAVISLWWSTISVRGLSHSMLVKLDAACGHAWCVAAPELWGGRCYGAVIEHAQGDPTEAGHGVVG